jgi:Peptidase family M28
MILGLLLLPVGCATRHPANRAALVPPPWVEANLRTAVAKLAGEIGERNLYRPEKLEQSATWIEQQLQALGYEVRRQAIAVDTNIFRCAGATAYNLEATLVGNRLPEKNIIIGAHYDSKVATPGYRNRWPPLTDRPGTPGANDNASGVAALLSIARSLVAQPCARTLRFVFFANEEPPFFKQPSAMGSYRYAAELKAKDVRVEAMLSLEILGCYSKRPNKKRFWYASPAGLSDEPDYVAFVSDLPSWHQSKKWAAAYARHSPLAARTLAIPAGVSRQIGWSDDWAFWRHDLRAVCVTDTGFLRCDDYHEVSDTPDRLDYAPFASVVWALQQAIRQLANE